MKNIKWRILFITSLVCLLSVLPGVIMWNSLPESVPIHFNINNEPDNFAPKAVAVLLIPFLMLAVQIFVCVICDISSQKHGQSKKLENVTKWIIPIISVVLQIATVMFAAGKQVDIRRVAVALVSLEFLFMGNYLPKMNYIKNYKIDTATARKINRFCGITMVILGVMGLVSLLLPTGASIVWLALTLLSVIVILIYTLIQIKKK